MWTFDEACPPSTTRVRRGGPGQARVVATTGGRRSRRRRKAHLQDSQARQTRLRWSWTGLRPMSAGSGAWSSTRFFFGGWGIVIVGFGRGAGGGLSVESGGVFGSEVMVAERIYERRSGADAKPKPGGRERRETGQRPGSGGGGRRRERERTE